MGSLYSCTNGILGMGSVSSGASAIQRLFKIFSGNIGINVSIDMSIRWKMRLTCINPDSLGKIIFNR